MLGRLQDREDCLVCHRGVFAIGGIVAVLMVCGKLRMSGCCVGEMSCRDGLSDAEAAERLASVGYNEPRVKSVIQHVKEQVIPVVTNPLILLLAGLGLASYVSRDIQTARVIWAMMVLAVLMQLFHEFKGEHAAKKLQESFSNSCSRVYRSNILREVPAREVVPGDVVVVSAGDLIPADGIVLHSSHLKVNQSRLTGESAPSKKEACLNKSFHDFEHINPNSPYVVFGGSMVVSGHGRFLVERTGDSTEIGLMVESLQDHSSTTRFDRDIQTFTYMMIRFIIVLAPLVFLLQVLRQGFTLDAFMYSISVSVGLAPEMLPMILTACLVHGSTKVSSKYKCIVRRVNAMQALGTVDILLTDKTGTLTQDTLSVNRSVDVFGETSTLPVALAKISARFQSSTNNTVEKAIDKSPLDQFHTCEEQDFELVEDTPFDYQKRYSRVSLRPKRYASIISPMQTLLHDEDLVIYKGAVVEVIALCSSVASYDGNNWKLEAKNAQYIKVPDQHGERVLAVAVEICGEILLVGFITFSDPPKPTAAPAVGTLQDIGVTVCMMSGDAVNVCSHVASKVGISNPEHVLDGKTIDLMPRSELRESIKHCRVFARLTPAHKELLVREFQSSCGSSVAMLGDGVNDLSALQQADVGISVNTACDAARSASDILLTENALTQLGPIILGSREVFLNMLKYLKMAASSNFGNMFSVIGSSIFIPFIPMQPIQIVTSNFLYDVAQLGIPSDSVSASHLKKPLVLNIRHLEKFIVLLGFISSIFDFTTFAVLYYCLGGDYENQKLFQTGWFVEGLLSQTLIVFILRNPDPDKLLGRGGGRPSLTLVLLSSLVCGTAIVMPSLPSVRRMLDFSPLPTIYWFYLVLILGSYCFVTRIAITYVSSNSNKVLSLGRFRRHRGGKDSAFIV